MFSTEPGDSWLEEATFSKMKPTAMIGVAATLAFVFSGMSGHGAVVLWTTTFSGADGPIHHPTPQDPPP
jgi:hypothetical protein